MTDGPDQVDLETPDLRAANRAALRDLFPGALADGVLDAANLGQMLGVEVAQAPEGRERYGLQWARKGEAIRSLLTLSRGTLAPDLDRSIDFDIAKNVFIEGDNLEVLKLLQKAYNDRVKLIYIDPPYNTGNDFVYKDDFIDGLHGYLDYTGQLDDEGNRVSANIDAGGRRHSRWLSMMFPRLVLARNLLRQDGLIFVSIDDNELPNLRLLLDEVFGAENFVNTIIWHYGKMSNEKAKLPNNHEYILVYRRSASGGIFTKVKKEDSEYRNRYLRYVTSENKVLYGSVKASTDQLILGRVKKVKESLGKQTLADDDVLFDFEVEFKSHSDTIYAPTIKGNAAERVAEFGTGQKPLALLGLLLQMGAPEPDSLVLDFFAGSGSTAHAVALQNAADGGNRRVISVNIPEPTEDGSEARNGGFEFVSDITYKRLVRVSEHIEGKTSQGLKVFSLAQSNFRASDIADGELDLASCTLAEGADDVYSVTAEVLLAEGVPLDAVWSAHQFGDVHVNVADGVAVVVGEGLDVAIAQNIFGLDPKPHTVVLLEDNLAAQDALKANIVANARSRGITVKTV